MCLGGTFGECFPKTFEHQISRVTREWYECHWRLISRAQRFLISFSAEFGFVDLLVTFVGSVMPRGSMYRFKKNRLIFMVLLYIPNSSHGSVMGWFVSSCWGIKPLVYFLFANRILAKQTRICCFVGCKGSYSCWINHSSSYSTIAWFGECFGRFFFLIVFVFFWRPSNLEDVGTNVRHVFLLGCCLSWCFLRFYLSSTVSSSSGAHRIVKLGSCWGGWGNQGQNPSYHAPGVYRLCRNYMMLDTFEMAWKRRKRETTSSKALQGSNRNWRLKSLHTKKQNM